MRVVVVARPPGPSSKTRLAAAIGADAARRVAEALLSDVLAAFSGHSVRLAGVGGPDAYALPPDVPFLDQGDGDLGERLERVARVALLEGSRVWLVGGDIPDLDPGVVGAWEGVWADAEACLIPAVDGGFVALGLTACPTGVLRGIGWSLPTTGAEVEASLVAHGLRVRLGPVHRDVDTVDDLRRVRSGRTHAVAAALGLLAG